MPCLVMWMECCPCCPVVSVVVVVVVAWIVALGKAIVIDAAIITIAVIVAVMYDFAIFISNNLVHSTFKGMV